MDIFAEYKENIIPKGYIAQMNEVHLQNGNITIKWPFYTFFE